MPRMRDLAIFVPTTTTMTTDRQTDCFTPCACAQGNYSSSFHSINNSRSWTSVQVVIGINTVLLIRIDFSSSLVPSTNITISNRKIIDANCPLHLRFSRCGMGVVNASLKFAKKVGTSDLCKVIMAGRSLHSQAQLWSRSGLVYKTRPVHIVYILVLTRSSNQTSIFISTQKFNTSNSSVSTFPTLTV